MEEEKDLKDINDTVELKEPKDIRAIIAKNIGELRVSRGMTQLELAERLHYSDKAVSKWERGESVPEISTLFAISELFGVTLDYLVHEEHKMEDISQTQASSEACSEGERTENKKPVNHAIIIGMSVLLVWFIAAAIFVLIDIISPAAKGHWLSFAYAVPVSSIVWLIMNSIWFDRRRNYLIISLLVWTLIASIHLTFLAFSINIWQIYILGIPGQIVIVMWSRLKHSRRTDKRRAL